ncbi:MAG TPA: alpha-L-fucosidase [Lacipirellulaceae bacterium]|nr:alpha-L-fucosidase [Lacipirellulaceae bacterium]
MSFRCSLVLAVIGGSILAAGVSQAQTRTMATEAPYKPTAANLAAREAFRDDQFGVFIHWGIYSVPGRGEWVMQNEKMSIEEYEPIAGKFNPEKYNADEWVQLFKRAGAKYVTITSKHHDGFCMWDSKLTDWDVMDRTPYKKDILKQLADACQKHGLKLFFYHSQVDWHHPEYFPRGFTGQFAGRPNSGDFNKYLEAMNGQLAELLGGAYGPIGGIWFDGWWDQQSKRFPATKNADPKETNLDWKLRETYDLIHRLQPACLVGSNHHVAPFEGEDFQMFERDLPGENKGGHSRDAKIGKLPLETCDTLNRSWGYNAADDDFKTVKQCVHYLVRAAGRDANLLLNVGPRPDGTIDPQSAERLEGIGQWMETYEASVRPTRGGPVPPQPWGVSTQSPEAVYLHVLDPKGAADGWLTLRGTRGLEGAALTRMGDGAAVEWRRGSGGEIEIRRAWDAEAIDEVFRLAKP